MVSTYKYPFRRVGVDHRIVGMSYIWWDMNRQFQDPLPYSFQLQVGNTGLTDAADWIDVGTPVINGYFAYDDERRAGDYGKRLLTHYRVILTTSAGVYVSQPAPTYGELNERDWLLAREITRKELLRHSMVSREGYLLKRLRFGTLCTLCADPLTGEVTDSSCPQCHGVGFATGYHPPTSMLLDMGPEAIIELRRAAEPPGPVRPVDLRGRVLGFPQANKEDVWVDGKSDQRWYVTEILHVAEWRGIPLVVELGLRLAPYTDTVYQVEVGGEEATVTAPVLSATGPGTVIVDHDYCGLDNLRYRDACGEGISGATITAFQIADYVAGRRTPEYVVATSATTANGRWVAAMLLCPDEGYVLVFEKPGAYGPDITTIMIGACGSEGGLPSDSSSSAVFESASSNSSSSSSAGMHPVPIRAPDPLALL
jgi:hypothetical protein